MNRRAVIDDDLRVEAWRAMRADDLHADVNMLADAADDWLPRGTHGLLCDLLAALTMREKEAAALDNIILQHNAAMTAIDRAVQAIVSAEEKQGEWRRDMEDFGND
jgi:hypothetical protein